MAHQPIYVIEKCAMSIDGFIDDGSPARRIPSNPADCGRADEVRASCDAILVGAGTVRADDPALLVRSPGRQRSRVERGLPRQPIKVTITRTGRLSPG